MLNIAGPEYDFGSVVFVVLQECEHRRRSFDDDQLEHQFTTIAKAKLKKIKEAYDEFGGSPHYWKSLETEVVETVIPQYIKTARVMNQNERITFGIWRGGDPAARGVFALSGLLIGGVIKPLLPIIPTIENIFVLALAGACALYPELKRYTHERRHARTLNRLITDADAYQRNAKLHYMTTKDIRESFSTGETIETTAVTSVGAKDAE